MSGLTCRSAVALAVFLAGSAAWAQESMEEVKVTAEKVAGCVWKLEGRGGTMAVCAGDDGAFLVDDQFAPLTPAIQEAVRRIHPDPVRFVLNTHWHADHTGGNENLGKAGAVIVAHHNVRERMSTDQFMAFMNREVPAAPPAALPVVTFDGDLTFHVNGETVEVFHVPHAHTDGDAIVHFRSANVIHAGDVVFYGLYPFIDSGSGGSVAGVLAAVDRMLVLADEDTRIIVGHGPVTDRAGLVAYREMLSTISGRIAAMIEEGLGLDEIQAAAPTADFDEFWGQGFIKPDRFVAMIHSALSGD